MRCCGFLVVIVAILVVVSLNGQSFVSAQKSRAGGSKPKAQTYYEILGVPNDASARDIKRAYRHLAAETHPDKNPGDESANERFMKVSEAYQTLSDSDKRAHYDRVGHAAYTDPQAAGAHAGGFHAHGGPGMDPFEMFAQMFGGGGQGMRFEFNGGGPRGGPQQQFRQQQQSSGPLFPADSGVPRVEPALWKRVGERKDLSIVFFGSSRDGASSGAVPVLTEAAKKLKSFATVAYVDCAAGSDPLGGQLCRQEGNAGAEGHPVVRMYPIDSRNAPVNMPQSIGFSDADAIVNWVSKQLPSSLRVLQSDNLDPWLHSGDIPKVILFSNKASAPPLLKVLSLQYLGRLSFAVALETDKAHAEYFGVKKRPELLVVLPGVREPRRFSGSFSLTSLRSFLNPLALSEAQAQAAKESARKAKAADQGPRPVFEATSLGALREQCQTGVCVVVTVASAEDVELARSSLSEAATRYRAEPLSFGVMALDRADAALKKALVTPGTTTLPSAIAVKFASRGARWASGAGAVQLIEKVLDGSVSWAPLAV